MEVCDTRLGRNKGRLIVFVKCDSSSHMRPGHSLLFDLSLHDGVKVVAV
jgi:hypothetical protein